MMRVAIVCVGLLITISMRGQTEQDAIRIEPGFTTSYWYRDVNLNRRQVMAVMSANEAAYAQMETARNYRSLGITSLVMGGFLTLFPFQMLSREEDPQWAFLPVGVGVMLTSIPFKRAYTRHAAEAVSIYNNGLSERGTKMNVGFGVSESGMGIRLTFR
jgi:hypothetical protein